MNRDIEFRLWDSVSMLYLSNAHTFDLYEGMGGGRYTIMQFTGLKDKEGNKIFEGDVVYIAGTGNCEVVFSYGQYMFRDQDYYREYSDILMEQDMGEILGNVYENPELLTNK